MLGIIFDLKINARIFFERRDESIEKTVTGATDRNFLTVIGDYGTDSRYLFSENVLRP